MHIVGVPIIENCTRGMKKQVGKSQLFTKESLTKIQDKMRIACIKSFNKFYGMDIKLKEKQKGRNQDINVKDMSDYKNIKKQLAEKEKKLDKANKQTNKLDNTTKDINQILDNLKPAKFNKNNMVISNEDVEKIKNGWYKKGSKPDNLYTISGTAKPVEESSSTTSSTATAPSSPTPPATTPTPPATTPTPSTGADATTTQ